MAFREVLQGMLPKAAANIEGIAVSVPSAGAATATSDGSSGTVQLAADSDTTSRNKAATPASAKAMAAAAVPSASAGTSGAAGTTKGIVFLSSDIDTTSRDKAATPANAATQIAANNVIIRSEIAQAVADQPAQGVPVGFEMLYPGTTPPEGWLDESRDNGLLTRTAFPQLWAFAAASGILITETAWQAEVTANGTCGSFSMGDGSTTFRVPLLRRVFARAVQPGVTTVGQFQGDAIRNITGTNYNHMPANDPNRTPYPTGAMTWVSPSEAVGGYAGASNQAYRYRFDASLVVPTADENRPVTVVRLPIIKAYDTATVSSNLEVAELINQITAINDSLSNQIAIAKQFMHVQDQKAAGVSGGTLTSGAWRTRDLNTIISQTISGASLSNNSITLPAGTYDISISVPGASVDIFRAALYSVTENKYVIYGTTEKSATTSGAYAVTKSLINGRITLQSPTVFEVRQRSSASNTNGMGVPYNMGIVEIYTEVIIRRVA